MSFSDDVLASIMATRTPEEIERELDTPRVFVRRDARPTSVAAAASVLPRTGTQKRKVYNALVRAGARGLTDEELFDITGLIPNSCRPRRGDLEKEGLIVNSGRKRRNRGGEYMIVWVAV